MLTAEEQSEVPLGPFNMYLEDAPYSAPGKKYNNSFPSECSAYRAKITMFDSAVKASINLRLTGQHQVLPLLQAVFVWGATSWSRESLL